MSTLQVPWFESPFFERELSAADLTDDQRALVSDFARDGYLQFHLELPDFDRVADEIIASLAPEHERVGNRVPDAWQHCPPARTLATLPQVIDTLRVLYQREPIPFQTLNFAHGSQQRAHSDAAHFNSMPPRFLAGVWIALEDVSEELGNGPLFYYPGSHKLPIFEPHDMGVAGGFAGRDERYEQYEQVIADLIDAYGLKRKVINARRGDVLIWSTNMLHGGLPVTDATRTRYTQVTHFFFEDCRYYNPLYSQPALAKYYWRRIVDLRTGAAVPHVVNGAQVQLPLLSRARYLTEEKLRNSPKGRAIVDATKRRLKANRG